MKLLNTLLVSILAILAPIKAVMITVGVLIVSDLIVGLIAARKRGEPITSAALRRTITKALVYELVIILGFLTETYLTGPVVPVVKIISSLVGLTELKSVLENLNEITGQSIFKILINKLGSDNDKLPPAAPPQD